MRYVLDAGVYKSLYVDAYYSGANYLRRRIRDHRVQFEARTARAGTDYELKSQWQHRDLAATTSNAQLRVFTGTPNPDGTQLLDTALDGGTSELVASHRIGRDRLRTGISSTLQHFVDTSVRPVLPDTRTTSGAAFGIADARRGALALSSAVRIDAVRYSANFASTGGHVQRNFRGVSGSVRAAVDMPRDVTLSLEGARSWRPPGVAELFATSLAPTNSRYLTGDTGLRAEQGFGVEGGAEWNASRAQLAAHAYTRRVDHWIGIDPGGLSYAGLLVPRYSSSDADLLGAEASATLQVVNALKLEGHFELARGYYANTPAPLPLMLPPRWRLATELSHPNQRDHTIITLRVEADGTERLSRPGPGEYEVPAFVLVHAGMVIERPGTSGTHRLSIAVRNVANTYYSIYPSYYPLRADGAERSFEVRFSFDR